MSRADRMWSRARSNSGASLGAQIVSSASNFVLLALVARALGPADYALFSGALAGWFLVLGIGRAVVVEPMVLRAVTDESAYLRGHRGGLRLGAAAGGTIAALALVSQLAGATSDVVRATAVLAVVVVALTVQDVSRWHFLARRSAGPALSGELLFAAVQLGLAGALFATDRLTLVTALLSTGAGATCSAVLLLSRMRLPPAVPGAVAPRDGFAPALLIDFVLSWISLQASLFVVAGFVTVADAGTLRATNDLFGPLRVLQLAIVAVALPAGAVSAVGVGGAARLGQTLRRARVPVLGLSAAYCLAAVVGGSFLLKKVYGEAFAPDPFVLVLLAGSALLQSVQAVQLVGLKALRRTRLLARFRVATTPPGLLLLVVLSVTNGVRGAALAVTLAQLVRVAWVARVLAVALRQHARADALVPGTVDLSG